ISIPYVLKLEDKIRIEEYIIEVDSELLTYREDEAADKTQIVPSGIKKEKAPSEIPRPEPDESQPVSEEEKIIQLKATVQNKLIDFMDLKRVNLEDMDAADLRGRAESAVKNILKEMQSEIPKVIKLENLIKDILDEALGLGPLEDLLSDPRVNEIMVNSKDRIYVEISGKLTLSNKNFSSNEAVLGVIERIVAPIGRRIDESSPLVDARLMDGSRVNVIIPPLALNGPTITIRKFSKEKLRVEDLIRFGAMTENMAKFLKICVENRKNILISGGTGSGKTTLLNVLSSFIPEDERIVTIEDAAELQLSQDHVVSLESRPPNIEGKGAIHIRDLVKNSLRMRPDRIVIGECRGGEALDMLQAMNTGHDGSLTTGHANTPRDMLSRLETMVLMSGVELPSRAIRDQIASAIDIIVQQTRLKCGARKIIQICEITGMEGEIITLQDIFKFEEHGFDENGKTIGEFKPSGYIPRAFESLRQAGISIDMSIFQ
ncbi:MAG: CpaF family protein, partial [Thermodesulfobacteriota bacterium]|nr:CpaF family protein [Thermodesulfobacteriota bacterium]